MSAIVVLFAIPSYIVQMIYLNKFLTRVNKYYDKIFTRKHSEITYWSR